MTNNVTGYVIDVMKTSTHISSVGYTYISGATVSVGTTSTTTSANGYFNVSGADPTVANIVVTFPKYMTVEIPKTNAALIAMWKNKYYL